MEDLRVVTLARRGVDLHLDVATGPRLPVDDRGVVDADAVLARTDVEDVGVRLGPALLERIAVEGREGDPLFRAEELEPGSRAVEHGDLLRGQIELPVLARRAA